MPVSASSVETPADVAKEAIETPSAVQSEQDLPNKRPRIDGNSICSKIYQLC